MSKDNHFVFDIETLGTHSNSVVLSWAAVAFDPGKDFTFNSLLNNGFFAKLSVKEQTKRGRNVLPGTLEWWSKQSDHARKSSFLPDPDFDMEVQDAHMLFVDWLSENDYHKDSVIWVRGSLDQLLFEHLEENFNLEPAFKYWQFRDVRTAIEIYYGAPRGYCDTSINMPGLVKHDPLHDCAMDAVMLKYGVEK